MYFKSYIIRGYLFIKQSSLAVPPFTLLNFYDIFPYISPYAGPHFLSAHSRVFAFHRVAPSTSHVSNGHSKGGTLPSRRS